MIPRTPPKITNRSAFIKYLEVDLWNWLKDLSVELLKVSFSQNFQSFTVTDLTIPAGMEVAIPNKFASSFPGLIPTSRIITRQQGDANIIDGVQVWTETQVYLRNPSANDAVISVIFLK